MPAPEGSERRQKALWWRKTGKTDYGEPVVAPAVEILVRWENKRDTVAGKDGSPIAIDAQVDLGQRVYPGDLMWLGTLADWNGTSSIGEENEIMEVDHYDEIPDLKNREVDRTAGLVLFKGTLPGALA